MLLSLLFFDVLSYGYYCFVIVGIVECFLLILF
jgi:hypothetical protein